MTLHRLEAKSLLIKQKRTDAWFVARYGMNIYRGCAHACAYCDGRAERYYVEGEFGRDVYAKINAPDVLRRELDPRRKRLPLPPSYVLLGGGVGDSYQPCEAELGLTRRVLEVLDEFSWPVHVLTKSTLVERDVDLLRRLAARRPVIVSMSLSTGDDELARVFEPGAALPSARLATLARLKQQGFPVGMFYMPAIPVVADDPETLDQTLAAARRAGVDFVVFSGMTLKEGRQKDHFLKALQAYDSTAADKVRRLYPGDGTGRARLTYYARLEHAFGRAAKKHGLPRRIPARLFGDILEANDRVTVILENMDYLLGLEGRRSSFRRAAWSVAQLRDDLSLWRNRLCELPGVGPATEKIILEIIETGGSSDYESLL